MIVGGDGRTVAAVDHDNRGNAEIRPGGPAVDELPVLIRPGAVGSLRPLLELHGADDDFTTRGTVGVSL